MKFDDFRTQVINEIRTYLGQTLPAWFDDDLRWYFDLGNTVGWTAGAILIRSLAKATND